MQDIRKYIEESNAIEDIFDPAEIDQSMIAWNYLLTLKTISHYDICRIQKIITINQSNLQPHQRGYYRSFSKTNVIVGDHTPPDYSEVDNLMENWLQDLPKMSPLLSHLRFEYIHPFVDGNGRVGRMLYWYFCNLIGKKPILFRHDKKKKYYALFNPKRIEMLKQNSWGVDFKPKYEVTIKTTAGIQRGLFDSEPSDKDIRDSVKEGEYISLISVKQL